MNTIISLLALLLAAIVFYKQRQITKKEDDKPPFSYYQCWVDFIKINIDRCKTASQCMDCQNLIKAFSRKFYGEVPEGIFNEDKEKMWNRADTKYKALRHEEGAVTFLKTCTN